MVRCKVIDVLSQRPRKFFKRFLDYLHIVFPVISAIYFLFPARKLYVIGVTGTDGKSSAVTMISKILKTYGHKVGHFSSISYSDGIRELPNNSKMTTPGRFYLQKFLKELVKNQCTHAVLEITSEGIKQYRHLFISFNLVVLTNITQEHLESHGGFKNYWKAKESLFKKPWLSRKSKKAVINLDGWQSKEFTEKLKIPFSACSFSDSSAYAYGRVDSNGIFETKISIKINDAKEIFHLKMGGPFITQNALIATTASLIAGVPLSRAKLALEAIDSIPGRFDIISKTPLIIVDYGHTVAALEKLLPYIHQYAKKNLVHVFGAAGGGRDKWKRSLLARISEKYSDISIITEENPFDENPDQISADIIKGFSTNHKFIVIPKREDAVRKGYELVGQEGTLLLTAKGSEAVIAGPKGSRRPYNEREYLKWLISQPS